MTGYGCCEIQKPEYKLSIEIKAVNHRYCDLSIKLPKKFNAFEQQIRTVMKEYAQRGKIDVFIGYEEYADSNAKIVYHANIAKEYMQAIREAQTQFGLESEITPERLIRFPEVVSMEEENMDLTEVYPVLEEALRGAAGQFTQARQKEGQHLKEDLLGKLEQIERSVTMVEERSPAMLQEYRRKITEKVQELLGDTKVDDSVLATELAVFADKVCVDEETVRLRSHIKNMRDTFALDEPVGRKLDFIAQEMNREANTILSKANDRELSNTAIDLKTEIEKVREQIQNIE